MNDELQKLQNEVQAARLEIGKLKRKYARLQAIYKENTKKHAALLAEYRKKLYAQAKRLGETV